MISGPGRVVLAALAAAALAIGAAHADEGIRLKPYPPVAKGIPAFPRLVGGTNRRAAVRINRALAAAEQGLGCDNAKGYWNRTVAVTMRGPRYLSLIAHDDYYCGTAYPDVGDTALVFDLHTGIPIDWKRLFPAGFVEAAGSGPGGSDSAPVTVASAMLWTLYAKLAAADLKNKECRAVLADPPGTGLMLWPDAAADGLRIEPAEFPHVVKACGPAETLGMAELRKLDVSAALLGAIAAAHRRGRYDATKNRK